MAGFPAELDWPKLVLASASPRRAELLRQVGADFSVLVPKIDESSGGLKDPVRLAVKLAGRKAAAAWKALKDNPRGRIVLAADTVVSYRHHLLGKPQNKADAIRMLGLLSGRRHQVITGLCLLDPGGRAMTGHQVSVVKFRRLTPERIRWYVSTGEPMDKAGAYGIQGRGALLVERIDGCYFNVVGLPLALLDRLLARLARRRA